MKPLAEGQTINIPMPRIQLPSQDLGGQGLPVGTPLGEIVEKRELDGLRSHNSLNSNNLAGANGKQPRRRSISGEGMA